MNLIKVFSCFVLTFFFKVLYLNYQQEREWKRVVPTKEKDWFIMGNIDLMHQAIKAINTVEKEKNILENAQIRLKAAKVLLYHSVFTGDAGDSCYDQAYFSGAPDLYSGAGGSAQQTLPDV